MGCGSCSHALTDREILRVAVFGLENSGKTSLVQCLKMSTKLFETSPSISTHGVIAVNIHLSAPMNMNLLIFDCGGCKHQRHIWPHLMNNADVVLFTVDSMDLRCLNDAREALFDLLADESLIDKPLLVVFTKSDTGTTIDMNQLEQALDLFMIQDRPIHKVLFSSVTLDGLTLLSAWLTYFTHCKLHGKILTVSTDTYSSTVKYRLPDALNLCTRTNPSTVRRRGKTKASSSLERKAK